ncbi:bifunctional nicotinamidase/pyrazinamidase [Pantoea sp. 1.19]|uniref:bifunctional nicotinamidase/pyrazinamidase n=1 Tax=Pantoea sp. 1.19 TaxID=1925589 RepID=UPI0009490574|nr:bifunctional nicotinamidase/pyrazinamidase [Pantoea sp. 1.19]
MESKHALVLIDLQNDFCPGGALAVNRGDEVIAVANRLAEDFRQRGQLVVASQDWHPPNHGSFASVAGEPVWQQGVLHGLSQVWWPEHCIQHHPGAAFHPQLNLALIDQVFTKGEDPTVDSYSAFFDNDHRRATGLDGWLRSQNVTRLTVMGLATDYCVKYSVLDALALGFGVEVIQAGCRGVDLTPGDSQRALAEMQSKGAQLL